MFENTDDWRVKSRQTLLSPQKVIAAFPRSSAAQQTVETARKQAEAILTGQDGRLLVVLGPCSIHDPAAALEYARHLQAAINTYSQQLHIVMRVYFEKPRTVMGWKGLINDPQLDGSHQINEGLILARKLLSDITALNVPAATEFIDTFSPHYLSDFITWGAIGARTTESRSHRELASALPMPIGFKNNTDGNIQIAIDAVETASHPHHFLSINHEGVATILESNGNPTCHIILRGSNTNSNYDVRSIENSVALLKTTHLHPYLMIDCSHGNSDKTHLKQIDVAHVVAQHVANGNQPIAGVMLESFLQEGRQALHDKQALRYGQSITDACLSWEQTLPLLEKLAESVERRNQVP
ncbi:MAG: 3-deoxy-7-phosphoheptulonate synthase [Pseudomonadota bacterium]